MTETPETEWPDPAEEPAEEPAETTDDDGTPGTGTDEPEPEAEPEEAG